MSGTHSLLAPSSAERWARCVGSLLLSKGRPDKPSIDAASGTLTHGIAEAMLKDDVQAILPVGAEVEVEGFKFTIDEERIERAQAYVNNLKREPGQRYIEVQLDTSAILGIPGQEGHSDCVTLSPESISLIDGVEHVGVVSVHDLKDGNGIVYAKNNLQGLIYGAAALYKYDLLATFNAVRFCIHQPRLNHYDEWTYSRAEIESFITIIRPTAKLAYDLYHGNVDFIPAEHLNAGEKQCQWCPARGGCPARAKRVVDMFAAIAVKHEIDDDALSQIYMRLDEIERACSDFRAEALQRAMNGRVIAGQKLVRGKRGRRYWKDKQKAEAALELVLPPEKMYEPREIVSPTEAEKALKAAKQLAIYESIAPYIDQADGGLSLAPLDDKREAIVMPTFEVLKQ